MAENVNLEIEKLADSIKMESDWDIDLSVQKVIDEKIEKKINNKTKSFLKNDKSLDYLLNDEKIKVKIQKRLLRDRLNNIVKHALYMQIMFMNLLIGTLIVSQTVKCHLFILLDVENLNVLSGLLKMYVAATIVELISLLGYIIKKFFRIEHLCAHF